MPNTPQQAVRRQRVETIIGLLAPALNVVLAAGERISKAVGPEDEYYPIRSAGEAFELPGSAPRGDGASDA